jgi:hypothetical protein
MCFIGGLIFLIFSGVNLLEEYFSSASVIVFNSFPSVSYFSLLKIVHHTNSMCNRAGYFFSDLYRIFDQVWVAGMYPRHNIRPSVETTRVVLFINHPHELIFSCGGWLLI